MTDIKELEYKPQSFGFGYKIKVKIGDISFISNQNFETEDQVEWAIYKLKENPIKI